MNGHRQVPGILAEALGHSRLFPPQKLPRLVPLPADSGTQSGLLMDRLKKMRLSGMARSLEEQITSPPMSQLRFEERLDLMLEQELKERDKRNFNLRLKRANPRIRSRLEEIDFLPQRGLSRSLMKELGSCRWIEKRQNLLITGGTGTGKTFIACAFIHQACLKGFKVSYQRLPQLLHQLTLAQDAGSYKKIMAALSKLDLLVLDDWGLENWERGRYLDLLEVLENRGQRGSTLVASQIPLQQWSQNCGDFLTAETIMDRLAHNAHGINLQGDSLRSQYETLNSVE